VQVGVTIAPDATAAGDYWRDNIDRRSGETDTHGPRPLEPPTGVRAARGQGQVTVSWDVVAGAVGYLVHRGVTEIGPFGVVDHGGGDVLVIPDPLYADTTPGHELDVWYAVSAVAAVDDPGVRSPAVRPEAMGGVGHLRVRIDAGNTRELHRPWRLMIGSEHLSLLLSDDTTGGRPIGQELRAALAIVHEEIGVSYVRAHAILDDSLGTYREVDGSPKLDFTGIDLVYDGVLSTGLRPVVEISFMPRDLALDRESIVFSYEAITSPPRDWDEWASLVTELARHLIDRYGADEVRHWPFEVWNEANLAVFWSGSPQDYFRLYDVTAAALRSVDDHLLVGGPSTAAAGWIESFLAHVEISGAPVDFVSTHTYGNAPIDVRPILDRHGRGSIPIWWTEWGPTPTHRNRVGDTVWAAAFLLRGMKSAASRSDAVAHWVVSDHFEELGRPPALRHGGFGLLTVGNLHKPRWWALQLLAGLGDHELAVDIEGDGAGSMVEALAAIDEAGSITVLAWNGTLDQSKVDGVESLSRHVDIDVGGVEAEVYIARHLRIDESHSNVLGYWDRIRGGAPWPTDEQWRDLVTVDTLEELETAKEVTAEDGKVTLRLDLPMPSVSAIMLTPRPD
jgi:xylan 1,4-beta-xylosidase